MHHGDLVEVTLRNEDVDGGVTVHWHGVDVPNAEDGVAGVTQDAVMPGGSHTLPLPGRAGRNVLVPHAPGPRRRRCGEGCFGALVIDPAGRASRTLLDLVALTHDFDGTPTLNGSDRSQRETCRPGTPCGCGW